MEALIEASGSFWAGLLMAAAAVGLILLLVACAGARVDESCEPEHDCSNCGHCMEHGASEACFSCAQYYPATPNWVPVLSEQSEPEAHEERKVA